MTAHDAAEALAQKLNTLRKSLPDDEGKALDGLIKNAARYLKSVMMEADLADFVDREATLAEIRNLLENDAAGPNVIQSVFHAISVIPLSC